VSDEWALQIPRSWHPLPPLCDGRLTDLQTDVKEGKEEEISSMKLTSMPHRKHLPVNSVKES